jgi:hypothetical protein
MRSPIKHEEKDFFKAVDLTEEEIRTALKRFEQLPKYMLDGRRSHITEGVIDLLLDTIDSRVKAYVMLHCLEFLARPQVGMRSAMPLPTSKPITSKYALNHDSETYTDALGYTESQVDNINECGISMIHRMMETDHRSKHLEIIEAEINNDTCDVITRAAILSTVVSLTMHASVARAMDKITKAIQREIDPGDELNRRPDNAKPPKTDD